MSLPLSQIARQVGFWHHVTSPIYNYSKGLIAIMAH
jgi:hypothetical protein